MVDKALAQDKTLHKRYRTPRAMEPVEQVDPKSYIGLAFERLGKDKRKNGSSDDPSSDSSGTNKPRQSRKRQGRRALSSESSSQPMSSSSEPDESSMDTDNYSSDSEESSSSSSCSEGHRGRRSKHSRTRGRGSRKTKRSHSKKHKSKRWMKLKPIPPVEYDGSVDSKAFHWFITEGTAYVKDGEVPSKKQAFILSHYLKGRAHEFYV